MDTIHLLPQHVIYRDTLVTAGLTRYPTTPGHVHVTLHSVGKLMSLPLMTFLEVMHTVRRISATLNSGFHTHRCGLTCDGSGIISLIPLHGLSKQWKPIVYHEDEYDANYPGYLTSKNGPKMADAFLEETRTRIVACTGIVEPFNNHFDGDASDQNIFARIVRGDLPQWRVWEDDAHVAFLTPFGNTPGFTVLIPRKHLSSDVFGLEDEDFAKIVQAAHQVAQHLKQAFGVERCGMFLEGYEIDYAHVKLVPVHDQLTSQEQLLVPTVAPAPFQQTYQGFLTTKTGPLTADPDSMTKTAQQLSLLYVQQNEIMVPTT